MAEFPLDPPLAKMLIVSPQFNVAQEIVNLAAMLSVPLIFLRPKDAIREADDAKAKFTHIDGDHLTLLNVYNAYKTKQQRGEDIMSWCRNNFLNNRALKNADDIREQLSQMLTKHNVKLNSTNVNSSAYSVNVRKCLIAGYFTHVAHLQRSGNYLTVKDMQPILIHPSSCLDHKPDFCVYHEIVLTTKNYIRTCTEIKAEWLLEIQPDYFKPSKIKLMETRKELERAEKELIEKRKKGKTDEGSKKKKFYFHE
mmetsp:Transcript_14507/g.12313  ORF Transcript_14507/g.12313 Transcript_14507/m.12313 type:complete len:253 (+) Transcript_14507:1315-2073(+)